MRILFITSSSPYPLLSGAKIRVYNLVKRVAKWHDIWLATFIFDDDEAQGVNQIEIFCQGVIVQRWQNMLRTTKILLAAKYSY